MTHGAFRKAVTLAQAGEEPWRHDGESTSGSPQALPFLHEGPARGRETSACKMLRRDPDTLLGLPRERRGRDFHPEAGRPARVEVGTIAPPIAIGLLVPAGASEALPQDPAGNGSPTARTLTAMPRRHLASVRWGRNKSAAESGDKFSREAGEPGLLGAFGH